MHKDTKNRELKDEILVQKYIDNSRIYDKHGAPSDVVESWLRAIGINWQRGLTIPHSCPTHE